MDGNIKRVVTTRAVNVDSVIACEWKANQGGVKEITADEKGVTINTNFNATFVPWTNVDYTNC